MNEHTPPAAPNMLPNTVWRKPMSYKTAPWFKRFTTLHFYTCKAFFWSMGKKGSYGSAADTPQSLHKTLTWTNPQKFLQNVRFKSFKPATDDDDAPPKHASLKDKVVHKLRKISTRTGEASLSHVTNKLSLHHKVKHHLDSIEKRTGKRSLKHLFGAD